MENVGWWPWQEAGQQNKPGRGGGLEQWSCVSIKPFLLPPYWPVMEDPALSNRCQIAWLQRISQASLPSGCYYRVVCCHSQTTRQLVWVSVRTSIHMGHGSSAHLFICPSAYQFVHPIIHPLVYHLSVHMFVHLSISYPLCMSIHPPSISPIIHLSLCPPVLSTFLFPISFYKRFAVDGRNSHHIKQNKTSKCTQRIRKV